MKKNIVKKSSTSRIRKPKGNITYFSSWKKISLLAVLLFVTAITVIVVQNPQTLLQHADVIEPGVSPVFHCLTLGVSHCSGVATSAVTACPGLTVVTPLKLEPPYLEQGESINGTVTFKNPCTNDTFKISIVATDPNGKTADAKGNPYVFSPAGQAGPGQQVTLNSTLPIASDAAAGTWTAQAEYTDSQGNVTPGAKVTFIVCGPLTVSQKITVNPTTVNPGQTVTGKITYKNTCKAPYAIKDAMIAAHDPTGDINNFTPNVGPKTIAAGGTLPITATRAMSTVDPLGTWKAFGAYQNNTGNWVVDSTVVSFVLKNPPPPAKKPPAKNPPPKGGPTSKACVAPLTTALTVQFATYTGGTVTVPSSDTSKLMSYAAALKKDKTIAVTVDGYTDATPFAAGTKGSITNNQQLSQARAQAVADYLKKPGGATNAITAKGNGVAKGATTNDAAARIAVVTSCGAKSSVTGGGTTNGGGATKTGTGPVTNPGSTCSTNCGQSTLCTSIAKGATCETKGTHTTGGSYVANKCPGGPNWQCWVPTTSGGVSGAACGSTNGPGTTSGTCRTSCVAPNCSIIVGTCNKGLVCGETLPPTSCASLGGNCYTPAGLINAIKTSKNHTSNNITGGDKDCQVKDNNAAATCDFVN